MRVILKDPEGISFILKWNGRNNFYNQHLKNCFEGLADNATLEAVKQYNIDPLSIFNIGSKSMLFYKTKKPRRYTPGFFLQNALKGKPVSYFKVGGGPEPYFEGIERINIELSDSFTGFKFSRIAKKLRKSEKANKNIDAAALAPYQEALNLSFAVGAAAAGKKDAAFVARYNAEIFNTHIKVNSRRLSLEEVNSLYESRKDIFDLTDLKERSAFIALYGIGRGYFSFSDAYSVEGIFSLGGNRIVDDRKQFAGNVVFHLFLKGGEALADCIKLLEKGAAQINPPPLDINDIRLIKKNYPLYMGLESAGRVLSKINTYDSALKDYAGTLCAFSLYGDYYDLLEGSDRSSGELTAIKSAISNLESKFL